jgi:hypothetical protein
LAARADSAPAASHSTMGDASAGSRTGEQRVQQGARQALRCTTPASRPAIQPSIRSRGAARALTCRKQARVSKITVVRPLDGGIVRRRRPAARGGRAIAHVYKQRARGEQLRRFRGRHGLDAAHKKCKKRFAEKRLHSQHGQHVAHGARAHVRARTRSASCRRAHVASRATLNANGPPTATAAVAAQEIDSGRWSAAASGPMPAVAAYAVGAPPNIRSSTAPAAPTALSNSGARTAASSAAVATDTARRRGRAVGRRLDSAAEAQPAKRSCRATCNDDELSVARAAGRRSAPAQGSIAA